MKTALILLALAWPAALPAPCAAQAPEAPEIIRGVSPAGALDGGRARMYREAKSRRLAVLPGYLAVLIPVVVFLGFICKQLWRGWLKISVRPRLEAGIKSNIAALRAHKKDEKKALASIEAMLRQHADLKGDPVVFNIDELPYIFKAAIDLEPLAQTLASMSGAARLALARKLLELREPQKSVSVLNAGAVKAAALAEGGYEAVVRIYDAAYRLDGFIDQYRTGQPPEFYSAYADALMRIGKYAYALRLIGFSQAPQPADTPRLFELNVRLGNFSQAEAVLSAAHAVRPLAAEGAAGGKKGQPMAENQEFYYGLALLCEEKGGKELAGKIYQLFVDAGQQYRDVKERYRRLKTPGADKTAGPGAPPALNADWWK